MLLLRLTFALWYRFLQCYAVTIFLRRYLDTACIANFECLTALNLSSSETEFQFWWLQLIFSSSSWLITKCQPEPSGWNPVGAVVSGASHYLYVDSQGFSEMGSRVKDSYVIVSDRKWWSKLRFMCMYTSPWKQYLQTWKPALCFLFENIGSSSNTSCSQTSICGKQKYKWR